MKTTIEVSKDLSQKLLSMKQELGVHSKEDVVQYLLQKHVGEGEAIGRDSDSGNDMDEDDEDEANGKLEKGLFFETIGHNAKSVKHFTGLKWEAYEWVKNALIDAVCECLFFLLFLGCPCALCVVRGARLQALQSSSYVASHRSGTPSMARDDPDAEILMQAIVLWTLTTVSSCS